MIFLFIYFLRSVPEDHSHHKCHCGQHVAHGARESRWSIFQPGIVEILIDNRAAKSVKKERFVNNVAVSSVRLITIFIFLFWENLICLVLYLYNILKVIIKLDLSKNLLLTQAKPTQIFEWRLWVLSLAVPSCK